MYKAVVFMFAVAALALGGCSAKDTAASGDRIGDIVVRHLQYAPGDTAIVFAPLNDAHKYRANAAASMKMPSASVIKVLIMAELMRRVEAGELDLEARIEVRKEDKLHDSLIGRLEQSDYSLNDLITMMIITSDNTATNVLINIVGFDSVNALAEELGLKDTSLQRKMLDWEAVKAGKQNYTSALDTSRLMRLIARGELISPEACRRMLTILNLQRDVESAKRFMPEDLVVAHKSGSLGNLEHDAGIFWIDGKDYILTIFTQNQPSNAYARDFIGQVAKDIYDAMGGDYALVDPTQVDVTRNFVKK